MVIAVIVFIIVIAVTALFVSKTFSPIPYFPSNKKDLRLIVKALNLKNNQTVIDLGAGDGIVIFEAAKVARKKRLTTKFVAVELNPILICILYMRRLFNPNRQNIRIIHSDIFKMNYNSLTREPVNSLTIYLYISPWFLEKVIENCKLKIVNFSVISYFYPIKSLAKKQKTIRGANNIYVYK